MKWDVQFQLKAAGSAGGSEVPTLAQYECQTIGAAMAGLDGIIRYLSWLSMMGESKFCYHYRVYTFSSTEKASESVGVVDGVSWAENGVQSGMLTYLEHFLTNGGAGFKAKVKNQAVGQYMAACIMMLRTLTIVSATYLKCKQPPEATHNTAVTMLQAPMNDTNNNHVEDVDDEDEEESDLETALSQHWKARLSKLLKVTKEISMARDRNSITPRALGMYIQVEPDQDSDGTGQGDTQRSSAAITSRKCVLNWNLGSIKQFPRPIAPPVIDAFKGRRWLCDETSFDEYEGGPTIEMLRPPSNVDPTMIYHSSGMELSAAWATWVDHGYRIRPSTFQMFYQCQPIATMEHIMPIGTLDSYDASAQIPDRVTGNYTLDRQGPSQEREDVVVNDVVILSASDMIDLAAQYDPPLQEECRYGHDLSICGCTNGPDGDEKMIYVDLEQDAIKFDAGDISISVDIDSIIWTTKTFRLHGTIGIYMTPPLHLKPGISRHNHTYLDLLIPQSQEDAHEPGGRTEWLSMRVKMDSIPHLCIGCISSAASTLNVYIFFPRLKYDNAISGKRVTIIPNEVEDIFWERVLLPAIGDCADTSWQAYLKQSLNEARYKNKRGPGATGGRGTPKIIPLSNNDFLDVQERMNTQIKNGQLELSMFGSSFFVLEGKGIKLITKDSQRGLWRLDALEASFGAGGYNRGQLHHHNTLSRYGALQAEMQRERSQQTHIGFRSAYNLYYEAVRTTNNQCTTHLWLMLKDDIFQGIRSYPESLQEAMKHWTITSVTDTLPAVTFEACNGGLKGSYWCNPWSHGPKVKIICSSTVHFFPSSQSPKKANSQWFSLWTGDGYIAEFHRLLKDMDEREREVLQEGLAEVLSNLHCLPASNATVWRVKQSTIIFVTNLAFYKNECLGRAGHMARAPAARRPVNVIKGKHIFTADLMDVTPFDALGARRKHSDRQKRRDLHKRLTMKKSIRGFLLPHVLVHNHFLYPGYMTLHVMIRWM
ncbi:hypothetical protein P692DRAFT_20822765 [Suillus brevipes Sb2]|nr:hypothetical protein P692DRAFT_20822765 [Suillus brevipes Sb2]